MSFPSEKDVEAYYINKPDLDAKEHKKELLNILMDYLESKSEFEYNDVSTDKTIMLMLAEVIFQLKQINQK